MLTPINTVQVATLAEDRVKACFATLLELIFFNEWDEEARRFFSISLSTKGSKESISIIADATDLAAFEPGDITVDETLWAVLLVGEGSVGFESVGVVERITDPLASAAIPVLYISTVSSDFVLIPVDRVAAAHAVKAGMGAGEYAGKFANLRSLVYIIGDYRAHNNPSVTLTRKTTSKSDFH